MTAAKKIVMTFCVILASVTFLVYWPVLQAEFVNYDDIEYVVENRHLQEGPLLKKMGWALSSFYASNWHPLTWWSHLLDIQLFAFSPSGHHAVNILLHIMNACLLFYIFYRMSGNIAAGALVALLFTIHPINVESVAWISERKNVLSTLFWIVAMIFYFFYTQKPMIGRYLAVFLAMLLGLMAKQMLVTLPLVLLLMDYWPLKRVRWPKGQHLLHVRAWNQTVWPLIREKIPLFILSFLGGIVAFLAQQQGGAMKSLSSLTLLQRTANAAIAYVKYLGHCFWPMKLAVMYPHPGAKIQAVWAIVSFLFIIFITLIAWFCRKRAPFMIVGWLWFLITLLPVIGLIQIGGQAMADRYAYVPFIGLFLIVSFGWLFLPLKAVIRWSLVAVVMVFLGMRTYQQAGVWRNSLTLFKHAVQVTQNNGLAHLNLGVALAEAKQYEPAIYHFQEVVRIEPEDDSGYNNLGYVYLQLNRLDEAERCLLKALTLDRLNVAAHNNLGKVLVAKAKYAEAVHHFKIATQLMPFFHEAQQNLRAAEQLLMQKKTD